MALNARQRKFVDAYLLEPNATKAAVAAGYSQKTAHSAGPRLLRNVAIRNILEGQQAKAAEAAGLSLQAHLDRLNDLATKAATAEQYGPAVNAEVHRGKAVGLYVDKQEVRHKGAVTVRVKIEREGRRRA